MKTRSKKKSDATDTTKSEVVETTDAIVKPKGTTKQAPKNAIEAGTIKESIEPATGFKALASMPKGWTQAGQSLDRVRALSTCFPDFDRATRVGGLPLRRIITIHGPTHGGKSAFIIGLLRSFVDAGHIGAYIDAEHATDLTWIDELFERPVDEIPNFFAKRPRTYEDTIEACDAFLNWMIAERKGRFGRFGKAPIPPEENLAGLMVIDSLNKLTPKKELAQLTAKGGEALDKGWGRMRANYNQAFLDHIVPLLGPAETSLGLIVQEREDEDLEVWEMPKLKGGKASQYDASMIIRVMKGIEVKDGEGKDKVVYGFKHKLQIWKSKVGHMDGRFSIAHFHTSNGTLIRPGFDTARDAIEVGKELGLVTVNGSYLAWRKKRWQGAHNAVVALTKDIDSLHQLLSEINKKVRPEAV